MKYRELGIAAALLAGPAALLRRAEFKTLNRRISLLYSERLTPWLERDLQETIGAPGLRLKTRHSVHQEDRFNVLESDLDLSALLPTPSCTVTSALKRRYLAWRRLLPFLGEMEIYEPWEWELRRKLRANHEKLFNTLWALRKWVWQHESLSRAGSRYHSQKAARSIEWIRRDLGFPAGGSRPTCSEGSRIASVLVELCAGQPEPDGLENFPFFRSFSRRSDYLGWTLNATPHACRKSFCLELERKALFALLSLLPDGHWIAPEEPRLVEPSPARNLLCLDEYLLYQSVKRTSDRPPNDIEERWERHLIAVLSRNFPKEHLDFLNADGFGSPLHSAVKASVSMR